MKIVFMGTPDFSVPTLQALINHDNYDVIAVFTQPPRPAGRGHKVQLSPIHQLAEQHQLPVYCPVSLKKENEEAVALLSQADIAVVVAYGLLLPKIILDAPTWGCVNIHASLLPRWRGAAPIQRAIEAGDTVTGVTIMQMDIGMDTGDIISMKEVPITSTTSCQQLHDRLSDVGSQLLLDTLAEAGNWNTVPQPEKGVTHATKLRKDESIISWQLTATEIGQKIRAFTPWPGCFMEYKGERIKVLEYIIVDEKTSEIPGTVIDDQLTIACGKGSLLRPTKLQRPSRKAAATAEILRGFPIIKGEVLACDIN